MILALTSEMLRGEKTVDLSKLALRFGGWLLFNVNGQIDRRVSQWDSKH